MTKLFILLTLSFVVESCSSIPRLDGRQNASFDAIQNLPLGTSTEKIKSVFGKPDDVFSEKNGYESWAYNQQFADGDKGQRLRLTFNKTSAQLTDKVWLANDEDPTNLIIYESKFPGTRFVEYPILWCYGDSSPDETRFVASEIGITIIFRKTRQEVSEVYWSKPGIAYPTQCTAEDLKKRQEFIDYWKSKLIKSATSSAKNSPADEQSD